MRKALFIFLFVFLLTPVLRAQAYTCGTASPNGHCVALTLTIKTTPLAGTGFNIYRGTAAAGESATPVNPTLLTVTGTCTSTAPCTITFEDDGANTVRQTYYYVAKNCDAASGTCSSSSVEASGTIPLSQGDLTAPAAPGVTPH